MRRVGGHHGAGDPVMGGDGHALAAALDSGASVATMAIVVLPCASSALRLS
jgi:hypothetical protein